jgi:ubiquitin C-terminal hydrolase
MGIIWDCIYKKKKRIDEYSMNHQKHQSHSKISKDKNHEPNPNRGSLSLIPNHREVVLLSPEKLLIKRKKSPDQKTEEKNTKDWLDNLLKSEIKEEQSPFVQEVGLENIGNSCYL